MKLEELILLDSSPCPTRNEWRKESVKILFYEYPSTPKPKITKFTLVQPTNLSPPNSGSNDCGVFVAQWMRECIWTDDYKDIYVCDGKRMRLALDLVLKPYNEMKAVVISLAFNYMNHLAKERKALVKNDGKAWNFYLSPI
ncbi:Ulp1 protease family, carboxy-terminal domain protein [Sesbania bispinosa]|nr:Ulp1 protease family, carboxy-terminal domain protein [Sesbania bispinosa]